MSYELRVKCLEFNSRGGPCVRPIKSLPRSKKNGGGGILLCKMTEGADVSDSANLSFTIVGADPCVRPQDRNISFDIYKRFVC